MAIKTVTATINGQEHNLTYSSSTGKWSATLNAPGKSSFDQEGGYYPVTITVNDDAGNTTTVNDKTEEIGESLKLVVKEKVKPTISIVSPATDAYLTDSKPTITVQFRDEDSGINKSTISVKVDSTTVTSSSAGATASDVEGGVDFTYVVQTALQDGTHTITANVSDNDGNAATEATVTFTVDTVAPSLDVTQPEDGAVTNQTSIAVKGTTTDATSGPVTVTIQVGSKPPVTASVGPQGAFSETVTLSEGSNTIKITATDKAGKTTEIVRHVTVDTQAPEIRSVTITPNPADAGATYIITVEVV